MKHDSSEMNGVSGFYRRSFLKSTAAVTGLGLLAMKPVDAQGNGNNGGPGNAPGNGNNGGPGIAPGNGNTESTLDNAEVLDSGAIVATDDDFVIAGQDVTIDDRDFYEDDGVNVIYNNGYSGEIRNNQLSVETLAHSVISGIRVSGGEVDVTGNLVEGMDALPRQFLGIRVDGGASSTVEDNTVSGGHRVGILGTGAGTQVKIQQNSITGLGPRVGGWAENGVQVSEGATGHVRRNRIQGHWWDTDDWQSSGVILNYPGDEVHISRNEVLDNDGGVILWGGDRHNMLHNEVKITEEDPGNSGVYQDGIWLIESTNTGVRQNTVTAEDGDAGIYVTNTAKNTKLIKNEVTGFDHPIVDQGEETKLPDPFKPS